VRTDQVGSFVLICFNVDATPRDWLRELGTTTVFEDYGQSKDIDVFIISRSPIPGSMHNGIDARLLSWYNSSVHV
jgi:hypothetical protein